MFVSISLVLALGCSPPAAERTQVLTRTDGGFDLVDREIPSLDDPYRLLGSLGDGYRGGFLGADGYREGGALRIWYTVEDGVAVPADQEGLILWSFYHHLDGMRADLTDHGYDTQPLFPLNGIAYNPVSVLDFQAVENAGYASGTHAFVIFPDLLDTGVPLAANDGVVRHEFGHAWFQLLTVGDVQATAPYEAEAGARIVNEGFADMVAALTLDEPRFILDSIDMPERSLDEVRVASADMYPNDEDIFASLLFDPYALGSVLASMVWEVRVQTGDPWLTLEYAVQTSQDWASEEAWEDPNRWAKLFVETAGPVACEPFRSRFPQEPDPC